MFISKKKKQYLNEIDNEAWNEEEKAQWDDDSCRCYRHGLCYSFPFFFSFLCCDSDL